MWLEPYELSAAVFLDVDPAPGERAPSRRLFLHGSGEHLVGVPVPTRQSCVTAEAPVATPGSMSTALGTGTCPRSMSSVSHRPTERLERRPTACCRAGRSWDFRSPALMMTQSFAYNGIFFSYASVPVNVVGVAADDTAMYLIERPGTPRW